MRGDLKVEGDYKKFLVDLHDWRHSLITGNCGRI